MQRMKRPYLVLVLVLVAAMLVSCTGTDGTADNPATAAPAEKTAAPTQAAATEPADESVEPVVLDYFMAATPDLYNGWQWGNDPITKAYTEACGVALNVIWAASSNNEELYTMLASGSDLPDMMRTPSYEPVLVDEQYVLALNELADEYCPEFYDVLPYQFREVYNSPDGNLYYLVRSYADQQKLATIEGGALGMNTVCINQPFYEELGKPALDTLDELTAAIALAVDAGSEYPVHIDQWTSPSSAANGAQVINCSFGGSPHWLVVNDDDTAVLNVRTDEYKAALNYLNDLYVLGYVQPRNFTFETSNDEQLNDFANNGSTLVVLGQPWGLEMYRQGLTDEWYYPIDPPAAEGINQSEIKLYDNTGSSIGFSAIWVMDGTEHPDACIKLLAYLLTDEAQIMTRWGIEGTHYTLDSDGNIVINSELDAQAAALTNPEKMNLTGYLNRVTWMVQTTYAYNYFFRPHDGTTDGERIYLGKEYGENCKLQNLCVNLTDTDEVLLASNVMDQWTQGYANVIFAESKAEMEAAYEQMIADMEKVGLSDLEDIYSQNLVYWRSRGIE